MKRVSKKDFSVIANGTMTSIWRLDTEAPLEAILAPGGLAVLAPAVAVGDRIAFIAGPEDDRVHGDLAVLAAAPAKADTPVVMRVHLIWSTREARVARKAA